LGNILRGSIFVRIKNVGGWVNISGVKNSHGGVADTRAID
jgi:hypothetical protein